MESTRINRSFWSILLILTLLTSPIYAEPVTEEEPAAAEELFSEEDLAELRESGAVEEHLITESEAASDASILADLPLTDEEIEALFTFEAPPLVYEVEPVFIEPRAFEDVFPDLTRNQRRIVSNTYGLRNSYRSGGAPAIRPGADSGLEMVSDFVMQKRPSHIVESLIIVPYNNKELEMLDIYNALGMIRNIQEQAIPNSNDYRIFKETTRLESAQNRRPIPDPAPATMLPYSETMYLRFTDRSIGDLYLKGDISMSLYGITYSMTNFRDINYSIFTVMGKERFSAIIYIEPVKEGIMIYCMSGIYLPDFIASRLNLTLNINNRITVFTNWIIDGLRKQDTPEEKTVVPYAAN